MDLNLLKEKRRAKIDFKPPVVNHSNPTADLTAVEQCVRHVFAVGPFGLQFTEYHQKIYSIVNSNRLGNALHERLSTMISEGVVALHSRLPITGENDAVVLLTAFCTVFSDLLLRARVLDALFRPLYSQAQHSTLPDPLAQCLNIWTTALLRGAGWGNKVKNWVLACAARVGEAPIPNLDTIRNVAQVLITSDNEGGIFKDFFELPFLGYLHQNYCGLYTLWSQQQHVASIYLQMVERIHHQDRDWLQNCNVPQSTIDDAERLLLTSLLPDDLVGQFTYPTALPQMILQRQAPELARFMLLTKYNRDAHVTLQNALCQQLEKEAQAILCEAEGQQEAIIDLLCNLQKAYLGLAETCGGGSLTLAVNGSFSKIFCSTAGDVLAEWLTKYFDVRVRSKELTEQDADHVTGTVFALFTQIGPKDRFELFHHRFLARRLLLLPEPHPAEMVLIRKLKDHMGGAFVRRLEAMINDVITSANSTETWARWMQGQPLCIHFPVRFSILSGNSWPSYSVPSSIAFPVPLREVIQSFEQHYGLVHQGRRLKWMPNLGEATLTARFKRPYEFVATTYQACILLHLTEPLPFGHLQEITQIRKADLQAALAPLVNNQAGRNGLVLSEAKGELDKSTLLQINQDFQATRNKIRLVGVATKEERSVVGKAALAASRDPQIEAAIVRVMKSRRTLHHNDLFVEVVAQLKALFTPNPADIKRRVESLIERQFLARSEEDRHTYVYLA
eukprot:TRINITY_DN2519_c0_g1_i1.p1 TRINITY_DN2519_c0_g1~~TRINITY_DN2519_c0_g1_i1.p1  ORF type:complete len:732 (-),score=79.89 TRINITY_DN2519_c0_g1_i1:47-2242(-)